MLLGVTGGGEAFPVVPVLSGVALQSQGDIEVIRWRHRPHRGYFWSERRDADRDAAASTSVSMAQTVSSCPTSPAPILAVVAAG